MLIVDYIVDWARDKYREGVIRALMKVANLDSNTLAYRDSDKFSTLTPLEGWVHDQQTQIELALAEEEDPASAKDEFRSFEVGCNVFRDIRCIRSRFVGLHITQDNFGDFLSMDADNGPRKLLYLVMDHQMVSACRVKAETLAALDSDWTGKPRGVGSGDEDATFIVVATVAAYLTADSEQTRELSYVAVEEGLLPRLLLQYTDVTAEGIAVMPDFPFLDMAAFRRIFREFRRQPAGANLLACISRVCLQPCHGYGDVEELWLQLPSSAARDFVCGIYTKYKVRNGPSCPFIRASSVLDKPGLVLDAPPLARAQVQLSLWFRQTVSKQSVYESGDLLETPPPRGPLEIPYIPDHAVLPVRLSIPSSTGLSSVTYCFFITDPDLARARSPLMTQGLVSEEHRPTFDTRRISGWPRRRARAVEP